MSIKKIRCLFFFIALFLIAVPHVLQADQYHYNNILVGERAAGLGGAYTAVSDDPSGLYYNPAGIVFSTGSNLSGSVNAYYSASKKYDSVLGGHGWERKSSALLPNYFGIIQPVGRGKIGFSYAVTDSIVEDQDQTFHDIPSTVQSTIDPARNAVIDTYIINFNNEDYTYNFGPSYAIKVSDAVSLGTTVYVHYRKNQWIMNQLLTLEQGDDRYEWTNSYYELTEWGIRPVLGIMWSPSESSHSVGLTLSKTVLLDSEARVQRTFKGLDYNADQKDRIDISSDEKREYPYVVTLGYAWFPSPAALVSADISYFSSTDDDLIGKRDATVNLSVGSEYYFTSSVVMRAGLFTNFANTPEIESGSANQPEHVDMYGGSLSLAYFTRGSTITIGTSYSYGTGEAQIITGSPKIQDVTASSLMVFVGASYSY